jgi:hypothetical protein
MLAFLGGRSKWHRLAALPGPERPTLPRDALVVPSIFFDPRELVSWVNKVRKLDTFMDPQSRLENR